MKTAMQELIEWMDNTPNKPLTHEIYRKANELLEKEKQQIIDAFKEALTIGSEEWRQSEAQSYYNDKYQQNSKP
jgi:hypothetical protein